MQSPTAKAGGSSAEPLESGMKQYGTTHYTSPTFSRLPAADLSLLARLTRTRQSLRARYAFPSPLAQPFPTRTSPLSRPFRIRTRSQPLAPSESPSPHLFETTSSAPPSNAKIQQAGFRPFPPAPRSHRNQTPLPPK